MNIVVLDGYTLNPGDLGWEELQRLGGLTVYDRTPPGLIVERSLNADILLTNKTPLRAETLANLPRLRFIGVLATGYDVVDVQAARAQGVAVANVPGYSTDSVAQTVFALLLELCHRAGDHSRSVQSGEWSANPDFSYWKWPLIELSGKTIGILGYGRIGEQVARIASAFGMKVVGHRRTPSDPVPFPGFRWEDRDELLRTADVVSLHCPLTAETEGMINRSSIDKMKRNAFLINTARGKLIVEADLAAALNQGRLAGAGLDVLSTEPPASSNPLLTAQNCIITPHIAWATREARSRLLRQSVANVAAYLAGTPIHIVNN